MAREISDTLKGWSRRSPAYSAPYKVVALDSSDPRRPTTYNIVDGAGLGVASFGISKDAAVWFRDAANEYAKRVLDDRRA